VPASAAGTDARRNAGGRPHVNGDSRFQSDTSLVSSSASASTTDPVTSAVSSASAGARAGGAINEQQEEVWPEGVLARVNTVAAGSPAEEAVRLRLHSHPPPHPHPAYRLIMPAFNLVRLALSIPRRDQVNVPGLT
jgi:hypothetical protein